MLKLVQHFACSALTAHALQMSFILTLNLEKKARFFIQKAYKTVSLCMYGFWCWWNQRFAIVAIRCGFAERGELSLLENSTKKTLETKFICGMKRDREKKARIGVKSNWFRNFPIVWMRFIYPLNIRWDVHFIFTLFSSSIFSPSLSLSLSLSIFDRQISVLNLFFERFKCEPHFK